MHILTCFLQGFGLKWNLSGSPTTKLFFGEVRCFASSLPCQVDLNGVQYLLISSYLLLLLLHALSKGMQHEKNPLVKHICFKFIFFFVLQLFTDTIRNNQHQQCQNLYCYSDLLLCFPWREDLLLPKSEFIFINNQLSLGDIDKYYQAAFSHSCLIILTL